jgi:hypothetical protein
MSSKIAKKAAGKQASVPPIKKRAKKRDTATVYVKRQYGKGYYKTNFKEMKGKIIESITDSRDEDNRVWTLDIRFTDSTAFIFDIDATPRIDADYYRDDGGNLEKIRSYGK